MDNKRTQFLIALSLLVCLTAIFSIGFSVKKNNLLPERNISETRYKEKDEESIKAIDVEEKVNKNKYYINVFSDPVTYDLFIDESGSFILKTLSIDYTNNEEKQENEKFFFLLEEEFNKVKLILDYIGEKNSLNKSDEYLFYYNEKDLKDNEIIEDKKYILDVINAIDNISIGEEVVDGKARKELGNEMLNHIIEELQLNNIANEKPAN